MSVIVRLPSQLRVLVGGAGEVPVEAETVREAIGAVDAVMVLSLIHISKVQAAGMIVAESYVSVTEVSEYAAGMPEAMLNQRLYPTLPPEGMSAFCFYPMSKRRGDVNNWYALDYDSRDALMRGHGAIGRTFRGRVLQLVTGSAGLDDWEWGVTLFAVHVDDLKECVYTMRYDEATTLYGDFGPFYTGLVGTLDEVLDATLA